MKIDWNDFEKMAQDKVFLSSVDREVGELIVCVMNAQQTFKHLTYDAQLLIAYEIERYKRENPEKDTNGLSGTFRGAKAVQFAQLVINLKNTKDNLQNTVMPLIEHLDIKTIVIDFDAFNVSVENIDYFLDNLEISYKDLRFADGDIVPNELCPKCKVPVYTETIKMDGDYPYVCKNCDENYYHVETISVEK